MTMITTVVSQLVPFVSGNSPVSLLVFYVRILLQFINIHTTISILFHDTFPHSHPEEIWSLLERRLSWFDYWLYCSSSTGTPFVPSRKVCLPCRCHFQVTVLIRTPQGPAFFPVTPVSKYSFLTHLVILESLPSSSVRCLSGNLVVILTLK